MKKNDKQRLFEVTARLDKTFKPKLNENYSDHETESPTSKFIEIIRNTDKYNVAGSDSVTINNYSEQTGGVRGVFDLTYYENELPSKLENIPFDGYFFQNIPQLYPNHIAIMVDGHQLVSLMSTVSKKDGGKAFHSIIDKIVNSTKNYRKLSFNPKLNEEPDRSDIKSFEAQARQQDEEVTLLVNALKKFVEYYKSTIDSKYVDGIDNNILINKIDSEVSAILHNNVLNTPLNEKLNEYDDDFKKLMVFEIYDKNSTYLGDLPPIDEMERASEFDGNTKAEIFRTPEFQKFAQEKNITADNIGRIVKNYEYYMGNNPLSWEYYSPSQSEELFDSKTNTFYNRFGQQLRSPIEYDRSDPEWTPFGDEGDY